MNVKHLHKALYDQVTTMRPLGLYLEQRTVPKPPA